VGVTGRRGFRPGPVLPNSHLLVGLGGAVDGAGWITTDHTGRTTVPGVWAAGAGAVVTGHALVAFYDSIFLLSQGFIPAVNALLLGSLLYQSRLVPRAGTRQAVCHDLKRTWAVLTGAS
jgi:NADPH-dependent 2,4-dienoyl-CoA reductase/sulfur reductase-like enzyme